MHNGWKTEAGCSPSWKDRIRERGSEEGSSTLMLPNHHLPMPGHSPATTPPGQSFSTASFNFKGDDKWRTSLHEKLESQQGSQRTEYSSGRDYVEDFCRFEF